MRFRILLFSLLLPLLLQAQKNRISLGYHQSYIVERDDLSKLGIQLSLERSWGKHWSTSLEWSKDEYCRCDVMPYEYRLRGRFKLTSSSPLRAAPAFSRLAHWTLLTHYKWVSSIFPQTSLWIGSGITYRTGGEAYLLAITPFEVFQEARFSTDWAIPVSLRLRYDPPHRWWGLTTYLMYQGYFHYEKFLGNNPMNVLHTGLNFDIRLGKREKLKTK